MSFLFTISTSLVLMIGRGPLLGILDIGGFVKVGLALSAIRRSVSQFVAVMTSDIFVAIIAFVSTVAAA